MIRVVTLWPCCVLLVACLAWSAESRAEATVTKRMIRVSEGTGNLLQPEAWTPWGEGFEREGKELVCDNAGDPQAQRGASQSVVLNQSRAEPLVATVLSRCEAVSGSADNDYSLYLDLTYIDGTYLWGQTAPFDVGTHDWQRRQVVVFPDKPIRQVTLHLLLRGHSGLARFRDPVLRELSTPAGATRFDGVPVSVAAASEEGFQVRDVAAESDFVRIEANALGLTLDSHTSAQEGVTWVDVDLSDTTGTDRAVTLIYAVPVNAHAMRWLANPRLSEPVELAREYQTVSRFPHVGSNGGLSLYPLGAVAGAEQGVALGIDMAFPAFFRIGYNASTAELFLAYDIGLTREKPAAHLRFCRFAFPSADGFRGALQQYYQLFPDYFRCRIARQGMWMPFASIRQVEKFEDFGFRFKEGDDETAWDDQHEVLTFRYTEPLTWWMRMPAEVPRTLEAATEYARREADEGGDPQARALWSSGYRDAQGRFAARLLDTPWCNGAVWSMNSMPGLAGHPTDFQLKWNDEIKARLYGPQCTAQLDGEYIDSSEGYVTDELDFCREHFAGARTPLVFSREGARPAIFRGLIAFEYVRAIAEDVHALDRLMMANATPIRLCWLAPWLDVMGTETDWNPGGHWQPMSDSELLFRRALCRGKPYCFLMNTQFDQFPPELVEKYMKRALAYGMFPGFFSHNASEGHYFTRPDLYHRDRPLFQKYVPLCRLVAEAGWEPLTMASSSDPTVYVERFGSRYFTLFNDSDQTRDVTITFSDSSIRECRELVQKGVLDCSEGRLTLRLASEDVAVLQLP